jgi:hypothetical protein
MKAVLIAGMLGVVMSVLLIDARPSQAQMMGWGMGMCREGYVYEPSRNVCVQKSKKARRSAAKKKARQ